MPDPATLSFTLPERPPVTRIRRVDPLALRAPKGPRTQPMRGFEEAYSDIVDYIVRITEEIWVDRAIGRIYDTYDHACTVYSQYGVVRSVEEVIASTAGTLTGFPDGELHHLNVAWSGDEDAGFYTSHLGYSRSTNLGWSAWGPPTGKRLGIRFAADCVSNDNLIHTEWLVRDNGAAVRQLGLDVATVAAAIAEAPARETLVLSAPTRLLGQAPLRTPRSRRDHAGGLRAGDVRHPVEPAAAGPAGALLRARHRVPRGRRAGGGGAAEPVRPDPAGADLHPRRHDGAGARLLV